MNRTKWTRGLALAAIIALAGFTVAHAAPVPDEHAESHGALASHKVTTPMDVEWHEDPDALPPGARLAVLLGDPMSENPLAMRAILPSEYVIPPHRHPAIEQGIVLSGTLYLGFGTDFDEDAAEPLPPGSHFAIAPGEAHYVFTKDEPVTFHIQSGGPWAIEYVDPADDPRRS